MNWNTLTDRQKQLDRMIDSCGVKLDVSDACLRKVMKLIGASVSETIFVKQCIELRLRTATLIGKTDTFISNTEQILEQFEKDDEEWCKKGHTLGFDF